MLLKSMRIVKSTQKMTGEAFKWITSALPAPNLEAYIDRNAQR
jgi:hypothetical protein